MKRIRSFIVSISKTHEVKLDNAIKTVRSLRVLQKSAVRNNVRYLLSVEVAHWVEVEDFLFLEIETDQPSPICDYTEVCVFDKKDMELANYFVMLYKSITVIDLAFTYNFNKLDPTKSGRPHCWETEGPFASMKKLNKMKNNMFGCERDILVVNEFGREEFISKCGDQSEYDELLDVFSRETMGWFAVRPKYVMKPYSPESTGVIDQGCPSLWMRGGSREIFDTRRQGYWPAYEQCDLQYMSNLGIHLARTRECYGEWASSKGDVRVAPQPRLVVSREMRTLLQKQCARSIQFVPIRENFS